MKKEYSERRNCGDFPEKKRSMRAVNARSLVVYVNAYADKLALRAVPRNVHEVFSGPALRAKLTHGFLRV